MTEDETTAKIRADLEAHVFPRWDRLRDPTVRPTEPCATCGSYIFWRTSGTLPLHCQGCDPCTASATSAYWYIAQDLAEIV
jgi:hypothetical protein